MLRTVLDAVRTARPGTGLDDVAERLGLSRDEIDAMVDYWVTRGELTLDQMRGCPPTGCTGCHQAGGACAGPAAWQGNGLITIRPRPDRDLPR